jgi:hypothetical protein
MELEVNDPREDLAKHIVEVWTTYNNDRRKFLDKGLETRRYVTASTTDDTEVGTLPWKNKTTIPKLSQIADTLQSYYLAALMPTDDWFRWEGSDEDSKSKANFIEAYMQTKIRQGNFRRVLEQLVRDWIIYGNCFAGVTYTRETAISKVTGRELVTFQGPKLFRISPVDASIDPRAESFDRSPFIRRSFSTMADLIRKNSDDTSVKYDKKALKKMKGMRTSAQEDDWLELYKSTGLIIDGFDDLGTYLNSGAVELIEYWGDVYDSSTDTLLRNRVIVVADRSFIVRNEENPAWSKKKPFFHSGWRTLPDNLYGQGPLDNLVGMQYRCDHLENLKADAFDQIIHPMILVKGDEVEDFTFGPGQKIYCGGESTVEFLRPDSSVLQANNEIAIYHNLMELMAGSPKEAMGFRTPGEKTAFEMSVLQQGSDRMFQDKLMHFEEYIIEPVLNAFFELIVRNFDITDIAQVFNKNTKAFDLIELKREDILADGSLKPIGARHFAARNKRIQELQNFLLIAQNPAIAPHISGVNSAIMFEEELGLDKWNIVEPFIGLQEQFQSAQLMREMQGAMGMPPEGEDVETEV